MYLPSPENVEKKATQLKRLVLTFLSRGKGRNDFVCATSAHMCMDASMYATREIYKSEAKSVNGGGGQASYFDVKWIFLFE